MIKKFLEELLEMKKKILIVDDEQSILDMLYEVFTEAGFETYLASSVEDALSKIRLNHIQVMFLDLNLPGMNGIELCSKIKKLYPITLIYSMTGYKTLFQLVDCLEAGFDDYFLKPVSLDMFIKAAENAFEKLERWIIR